MGDAGLVFVVAAVVLLAAPLLVWLVFLVRGVDTHNDDQVGACIGLLFGIVGVVATFIVVGVAKPWIAVRATIVAAVIFGAVDLLTGDAMLVAFDRIKPDRLQIPVVVLALVVWPIVTPLTVAFAFLSFAG